MQYVNLKKIVRYVYEEEIENDPISPEERLDSLYEKSRRYLLEIFNAVDFCHELLKKDGEYQLPKKDGEFIEWLLKEFTSQQMKLVRNGKYHEVNPEYLHKIIVGFKKMLENMEIEDIKIEAQMEIMMKKTEYPLIVRLHNIRYQMEMTLNNLMHYTYNPTFHMNMDQRCEYLDWVYDEAELFQKTVGNEFFKLWKATEKDIKENAMTLCSSDIEYSPRTIAIIEELHNNAEYLELKEKLEKLEKKKQPLIKYEKARCKIVSKMKKILNDVAKEHPIDLEQVTMLEKLMYTSENGFVLTHRGGEDNWYVIQNSEYKVFGRRS